MIKSFAPKLVPVICFPSILVVNLFLVPKHFEEGHSLTAIPLNELERAVHLAGQKAAKQGVLHLILGAI